MNRTVLIFTTAGVLVLLALVAAPAKSALASHTNSGGTATLAPPATLPVSHTDLSRLPHVSVSSPTTESGPLSLTARLPSSYAANGDAPTYVTVEVVAKELEKEAGPRPPVNLALVIDRSCSMSGQKIEHAKEAARALVEQLGPEDRLAVIDYGSDVQTLASQNVTHAAREQLLARVNMLQPNGSTNISAGLDAGEREVRRYASDFRASRIILVSDGQPTDGITSREGLEQRAREIREAGVTVTALGVGTDFDEVLMRGLAESGAGFYGFIEDPSRLAEVFSAELNQASRLVARNVLVTFEPAPGVRLEEALGKTLVATDSVGVGARLYDFSSGLTARTVMRLSVDHEPTDAPVELGRFHLLYTDVASGKTVRTVAVVRGQVTADAKLALQNADPQILEHAARAERAKQLQLAAVQLREGHQEEAERTLSFGMDNIRKVFGSSADALAGEPTIAKGRSASDNAKLLESKSMKSFGENNAY